MAQSYTWGQGIDAAVRLSVRTWEMVQTLYRQVQEISREPGPQGQPGPQGPPGRDGATWEQKGLYVGGAVYKRGDVVWKDGGPYLALTDDPGPLNGDGGEGWQLVASRGAKGDRGKPGDQGPRGPAGPPGRGIADLEVDAANWSLKLLLDDGSILTCDVRPLFARLAAEASEMH